MTKIDLLPGDYECNRMPMKVVKEGEDFFLSWVAYKKDMKPKILQAVKGADNKWVVTTQGRGGPKILTSVHRGGG